MRLLDNFRRGAALGSEEIAVIDGVEQFRWKDLSEHSERVAPAMFVSNLRAGSHIGFFSPNSGAVFGVMLGMFRLGGVRVPVNARATASVPIATGSRCPNAGRSSARDQFWRGQDRLVG